MSCYNFSTFKTTWSNARSNCLNRGGDLAIPTSTQEENLIENSIKQGLPWIGLVRHHDNEFYTVYGLKPTYTDWLNGEPNNPGYENCGHLRFVNEKWG